MFRLDRSVILNKEELAEYRAMLDQRVLGPWGAIGVRLMAGLLAFFFFVVWMALGVRSFPGFLPFDSATLDPAMLLVGGMVCWGYPQMARNFSFKVSFRSAFAALLIGVVIANLVVAIQSPYGSIEFPGYHPVAEILMIIVSPVVEEIFASGIVLNALVDKWPIAVAVVVDAIFFYIGFGDFWPSFVAGVILCSVYLAFRRSLTVAILMHAAMNFALIFHSWLMLPAPFIQHP